MFQIEAKKAIPKAEMNNPAKKVFVGGVALGVDDDQFREYFSIFGTVAESQIIRDRYFFFLTLTMLPFSLQFIRAFERLWIRYIC